MKKRKGNTLTVNFDGVEAGGAGRLLPEGPIQMEVEEAEIETGESSGKEYVKLTLKVPEGEFEGTKAWDNLSVQPQALWKMRGFMEAAGLETRDEEMEIDPNDFVGCIVMVDIIHEEYQGKTKHRVNGYSSIDEPAKDEKPSGGAKKKLAKKDEDDTPEWKLKQKVTFKDGKKTIEGVITGIDGDTITVKAGKDEYEMGPADIEAA